jgi:hypothetical protein
MAERQGLFITEARRHAKAIWDGLNALEALQSEWNALDYGNTLPNGSGSNDGVTTTNVGAVVFDTANAIRTVLDAGHATNIAKLL